MDPGSNEIITRLLNSDDIDSLVAFMQRHVPRSGVDGETLYNPYDGQHRWELGGYRQVTLEAWELGLTTPGWKRTFGACCSSRVVGTCALQGQAPHARLHRAVLTTGVDRDYRRRGLGTRLLQTAIQWALVHEQLDWLELGVFAQNHGARRAYERAGFVETGTTPDLFRVHGQSIDDISMALDLRRLR